jgi:hypothetical protein
MSQPIATDVPAFIAWLRDHECITVHERNEQDSIAAAQAQCPYIQPQTLTGEDTDNIKGQLMAAVAQKAKYGDTIYDSKTAATSPNTLASSFTGRQTSEGMSSNGTNSNNSQRSFTFR